MNRTPRKRPSQYYLEALGKWLLFSLTLGLVPLWIPLVWYQDHSKVVYLIGLGVLIFYGWGLATQVLTSRYGALFYSRFKDMKSFRSIGTLLTEVVVPLIILMLSTISCSKLLGGAELPTHEVIKPQLYAGGLGLVISLVHEIQVATILAKGT